MTIPRTSLFLFLMLFLWVSGSQAQEEGVVGAIKIKGNQRVDAGRFQIHYTGASREPQEVRWE